MTPERYLIYTRTNNGPLLFERVSRNKEDALKCLRSVGNSVSDYDGVQEFVTTEVVIFDIESLEPIESRRL